MKPNKAGQPMKPVLQQHITNKMGDCFGACVASILEIPEAPNFHTDTSRHWLLKWDEWLWQKYWLHPFYAAIGSIPMPQGYSILTVRSALFADTYHAVVYQNGEGKDGIVWNPNPLDPRGVNIDCEDWIGITVFCCPYPGLVRRETRPG